MIENQEEDGCSQAVFGMAMSRSFNQ